MKYRKKPVVIEAFKWIPANPVSITPEWFFEACKDRLVYPELDGTCSIQTLEGRMIANYGDYIIKGIRGELYPCKPDIFEATYEEVHDA